MRLRRRPPKGQKAKGWHCWEQVSWWLQLQLQLQAALFWIWKLQAGRHKGWLEGGRKRRKARARRAQSSGAELESHWLSTAWLRLAAKQPPRDLPCCSASNVALKYCYCCKRLEVSHFQESPRKSNTKKPLTVNEGIWTNASCPKSTGIDRPGCPCFCIFCFFYAPYLLLVILSCCSSRACYSIRSYISTYHEATLIL